MRSASSNLRHALILLVDDNADGIIARKSVLEELGYRVITAATGLDALKHVESECFDLVVTDFRMEPMDGLQLISELRNRNFTNPIILLSGFADTLGLKPESTGADAVLQKSANEINSLVRCAHRLLNPRKPAGKVKKAKIAFRESM
jgi:CheY-like chemotaxis protein